MKSVICVHTKVCWNHHRMSYSALASTCSKQWQVRYHFYSRSHKVSNVFHSCKCHIYHGQVYDSFCMSAKINKTMPQKKKTINIYDIIRREQFENRKCKREKKQWWHDKWNGTQTDLWINFQALNKTLWAISPPEGYSNPPCTCQNSLQTSEHIPQTYILYTDLVTKHGSSKKEA